MRNLHLQAWKTEDGFLSLLGCCMLLALLFCGMTLTHLAKNEVTALQRYQTEIQLYHAAKSCMERAAATLEKQQIPKAADTYKTTTCILDVPFTKKIRVKVNAKEKDGAILLMSCAEQRDLWGCPAYQAVYGCMKKEGGSYVWTGCFEQDS